MGYKQLRAQLTNVCGMRLELHNLIPYQSEPLLIQVHGVRQLMPKQKQELYEFLVEAITEKVSRLREEERQNEAKQEGLPPL